jgi:hypothetical protein
MREELVGVIRVAQGIINQPVIHNPRFNISHRRKRPSLCMQLSASNGGIQLLSNVVTTADSTKLGVLCKRVEGGAYSSFIFTSMSAAIGQI